MTTTSARHRGARERRGRPAGRTDPRSISGSTPVTSSATACASSTRCTATGERTVLLLPTWSIVHSRFWKVQIPYLARHFRVVTFDGRGNGRSDRPAGADAYSANEFAADALAVMDATEHRACDAGRAVVRCAVGDDPRRRSPRAGRRGSCTSALR